ncbi:MAG: DUF1566 domain-containing protein [Thermoplasmatales archaeon]|nr:DUF1566 domain-containing protein [Thermoplasmatales archaeon]
MSRTACIVLIALLTIPCISSAETVDVHIKGVDDGIRTSIQQDYKEAVLFAKREAIERAGVKVKSLTTAKDLVIHSDYIESKAEAVLLPGYSIIDVGYQQNGTYLVILSGKVKTSTPRGRFFAYDNGTVKDTKTGLVWASKDNGENINWNDAKRYCENYRGGGYMDWRMPTLDELTGLYDKSKSYQADQGIIDVHLTKLIQLTSCCVWASNIPIRGSLAAFFSFYNGSPAWMVARSFSGFPRALPVRGGN